MRCQKLKTINITGDSKVIDLVKQVFGEWDK